MHEEAAFILLIVSDPTVTILKMARYQLLFHMLSLKIDLTIQNKPESLFSKLEIITCVKLCKCDLIMILDQLLIWVKSNCTDGEKSNM